MLTELDKQKLRDLDIRDVAERLGLEVKQRGNSPCFNTLAHKNGDRHPSLSFDSKTNKFKCFACGVSGDTIDLVAQVESLNYVEAYQRLAELMGISLERGERRPSKASRTVREYKATNYQEIRLNEYLEYNPLPYTEVYQAFYDATEPPSDELKAWWHGRGLSDELLAKAGWRTITPRTWQKIEKMYDEPTLLASGLKTQNNGQIRQVFWGSYNIAIPFYNATIDDLYELINGKPLPVLLVRARSLDKNAKAKYLSPVGTSPTLYGYETVFRWASLYPSQNYPQDDKLYKPLMITESETDALACRELSLRKYGDEGYAVALCGGGKNEHSPIVRELVKVVALESDKTKVKVRVCVDADETGEHFFNTIGNALYQAGIPAENIERYQPWADLGLKDMGDYLRYIDKNSKPRENGVRLE
jgi:DNA primase